MKSQEILKAALKFSGILFGFQAFNKFLSVLILLSVPKPKTLSLDGAFLEMTSPFYTPIQMFLLGFYVFVAWYLLTNSEKVAAKFIKNPVNTGITKENMLELVVLYNGIGLVIYSIPTLIISLVQHVFVAESVSQVFLNVSSIFSIIELIISFFLITRAKSISAWMMKKIPAKFWQ